MINDTEQRLLARVHASPLELTSKLIYADWLEERGDERAKFVRVLIGHLADPGDSETRGQLRALRKTLDPLWLVAVGDSYVRLHNIAKILDSREDADHFAYVKAFRDEYPQELPLRDAASCLGIHPTEDLFLDLEVAIDATDPTISGTCERVLKQCGEEGEDIREFIASPEIAPSLRSLYLWTLSAANGTAQMFLDRDVNGPGQFANPKKFATNFHNEDGTCIIASEVGNGYEEGGLLAKLLRKSPGIEELVVPSAPNHEFFSIGTRPLKKLHVAAGYDSQNFIRDFSRSDCFPQLEELRFDESTIDPTSGGVLTAFEDFVELLQSPAVANIQTITLSGVGLSAGQIRRLQAIRKEGISIRARKN
jgi:uncharacterized protein (TIGR02996 family)